MRRPSGKRGNGEGSVHRSEGRPGWRAQAFLSDGTRPTKIVPTVRSTTGWQTSPHGIVSESLASAHPTWSATATAFSR